MDIYTDNCLDITKADCYSFPQNPLCLQQVEYVDLADISTVGVLIWIWYSFCVEPLNWMITVGQYGIYPFVTWIYLSIVNPSGLMKYQPVTKQQWDACESISYTVCLVLISICLTSPFISYCKDKITKKK